MTHHRTPATGAPTTGLSHVQLRVTDVGASAKWYAAALGLEPYAEDLDTGYVALRHRGAKFVVVLITRSDSRPSGGGECPDAAEATDGGVGSLDHLAFAVPDGDGLRAWGDHLTAIGIAHAGVVEENGNPSLQLRDPDGIAIELVAPGGRQA
ncbi:MAG: VOC family protein [Acidimicrobiales bacterium]|nr:VOC family protein [Acidimicrobiales bacterium]